MDEIAGNEEEGEESNPPGRIYFWFEHSVLADFLDFFTGKNTGQNGQHICIISCRRYTDKKF